MRAAHWVGSSDPVAAKRHWMDAREHLISLPESTERNTLLLDAYPELLNTLGKGGGNPEESDAVFLEAITLAGAVGDRQAEGHLEAIHAWSKTGQADWAGALEHGRRAIEIADAIGDLPTQLFGRQTVTRALLWRRPIAEAMAVLEDLSTIGAGDHAADIEVLGWRPYLEALSLRAVGVGFLGRPVEALELHERVHALSERSNRSTDTTDLWADGVWTCFTLGDAERGRRYATRSLEIAERFGSAWLHVYALLSNALANNIDGRWHDTLRFIEEAHAVIEANNAAREWELILDSQEALARAGSGDHERALTLARSGLDRCLANDLMLPMVLAAYLRARVLRMAGDRVPPDGLEKQIDEAVALIEPTDNRWLYPMLLIERSHLEGRRGNRDAAVSAADEAKRAFRSMGVTGWDEAIAAAIA
jgi:tetratricopeptide (TPR) repeat protein